MASQQGLRLGTSLFSLINEFHGREYTLDQLIAKIAELGLGPGIEVVGFGTVKGFPTVTDEFANHFQETLAKHGLEPSCIGLNADINLRPNQPMSDDESLAYHEAQVRAAAKLGFPVARFQLGAGTEVIRRLAPLAEKLNVKLGLEIHAPESVTAPNIVRYREMYDQVDSPYLGFIPDFGACAKNVSPSFTNHFRRIGIEEDLIQLALTLWGEEGEAHQKVAKFVTTAKEAGFPILSINECIIIFMLFSRQPPHDWLEIMPQVFHIHGKFYEFDEAGDETAIPYEQILPVFVEGGYNGFMSSEWEGTIFSDESGFEKVQAHHALCRRILGRD